MSQPAPGELGCQVSRVQHLVRQACDRELRPIGLSLAQYLVLRALADQPGASSAELARRCFVTRQSVGEVLCGLRKANLVAVSEHTTGGRARAVTLTRTGRARLRAGERIITLVEERMTDGLVARDRRQLADLLDACAANLTQSGLT
jgi:DNA-binding MarR family transcriptional regulator